MPARLLMQVMGEGALRLLGPTSTEKKELAWAALSVSDDEEQRRRLLLDQRRCCWVRFEKDGCRIYLVQELLPVMGFPLQEDLDERVYVQASPDGDAFIFSVKGYLASVGKP
jgi:hypothetical protein